MIKQLLSVSFIAAACLSASAQITITQADIATIGTVVKQARDTMPAGSISPGPAGTNLSWNFAALNSHTVDTITFTNPAWTPNAASFPSSNLAVIFSPQFGNPGVSYLNNTASGLWILGEGDMNNLIDYNPDQELTMFPATYGSNYTNTYGFTMTQQYTGFPGVDSIRYKSVRSKTANYDAWGSLTTPLGTFNTLRSNETEISNDSMWIHSTGPFPPAGWSLSNTQKDTTYKFTWWANSVGFPLVEVDSTRLDGVREASWLMATPTVTSIAPFAAGNDISLYPNPATSFVTVVLPNNNARSITIFDASGRAVRTVELNSMATLVNTDDLPAGMYFYITTGSAPDASYKGKFTINK